MRCKECKETFEPRVFLQKFCKQNNKCLTSEALYLLDKKKKADKKKWNKEKKILKEKLKTKSDYEKELEKVFNAYIRERDKLRPCISCNAKAGTYRITAGHYYPAGSYKNVRFDEKNVWGQCWFNCNKNRHGNLAEYRIKLIERIGIEEVNFLDQRRLQEKHYTIPELIIKKLEYKEKLRKLKLL